MNRNYSIIIPVFNSQDTITSLCDDLEKVFKKINFDYEIILINDGSTDNSYSVMENVKVNNEKIKIINLLRNFGQHNALLCGIRLAQKNFIITMDDDLQHPADEIPNLIKKLDEGFDVVYGYPKEQKHNFFRTLASKLTKATLKRTMGVKSAKYVSPFRIFRKSICIAFNDFKGSFTSVDVLLSWGTNSFSEVLIKHETRKHGKSNYTVKKLLIHAINMLTGFTTIPLQIASFIGFTFSIFGILVLAYVIIRFMLIGSPVPGFPFIASIISIFSGAQLLSIGIIGEYLARIHSRVMDKPQYIIRDININ